MLAGLHHDEGCHTQKQNAADGEHPSAVATGLGQIKTGVVNRGHGHDGIAIRHGNILAIDSSRGGQQFRTALLAGTIFLGGNDDFDRFLEQYIPLIRGGFSQAVAIILQALHNDVALCIGDKGGSIGLLGGKALGVVDAILQVCDDVAVVGIIMQVELDVLHAALAIAELLQNIDAVSIHMAAVL